MRLRAVTRHWQLDMVPPVSSDHGGASIRVGRPEEYGRLRGIQAASGELFTEVGVGPFPDEEFVLWLRRLSSWWPGNLRLALLPSGWSMGWLTSSKSQWIP